MENVSVYARRRDRLNEVRTYVRGSRCSVSPRRDGAAAGMSTGHVSGTPRSSVRCFNSSTSVSAASALCGTSKALSGTRSSGSAKTCTGGEAEDGGDSGKPTEGWTRRKSNADPTRGGSSGIAVQKAFRMGSGFQKSMGTHKYRDAKSAGARMAQRSTRAERASGPSSSSVMY
jgi:hypothetical protein